MSAPISGVLAAAREECELAGHGYVGVEHLLVALTHESMRPVAGLLEVHGVRLEPARAALRSIVSAGRGDGPRWDARTLLGTLGIDLDEVRRQVETQFGPDAIARLYTGPVGWHLRPRGPLCEPPLSSQLTRTVRRVLGSCWDAAPPRMLENLLLSALDGDSTGLAWLLGELGVSPPHLRAAVATELRLAS